MENAVVKRETERDEKKEEEKEKGRQTENVRK